MSETEYQDKTLNLPFCEWKHSISHCLEYNSHGQCLKCVDGYFLEIDIDQNIPQSAVKDFIQLDNATLTPPEDENSVSYQSYYQGYFDTFEIFLSSQIYGSKCTKNPTTRLNAKIGIENCFSADKSSCQICFNNYYLDSDLNCQPHENIPLNCFLMSQRVKDSCLVCEPNFYLKTSSDNVNINLCQLRTNKFIENCHELSMNQDNCSICLSPYILHNNGMSCSPPIENCFSYKTDETNLSCSKCSNGFSLTNNNTICSSEIDKCSFRASNGNCQICKLGYFLSESLECIQWSEYMIQQLSCKQSKVISVVTGGSDAQSVLTCQNCSDGYFKKIFLNECLLNGSPIIDKCTKYDQNENCLKCASGYYFNGSICSAGSLTGCLIYESSSRCEICEINYMLIDGECVDLSNREIHSGFFSDSVKCLKWTETNNDITCEVCLPNYVIKKEVEKYVFTECVDSTSENPQIPNCVVEDISHQENNGNVVKCAQCDTNFYKNSGDIAIGLGTSCSSSCELNEMPDDILGTCQPKISSFPISNCSKGDGRSLCYSCESGHKAKYNLNFFHQSLFLWQTDYHSSNSNETKIENQKPFIEECINDSNNEVSFYFEIQDNSFEYRQFKTITTINGSTQYIDIKNCDTSSNVIFDQSDLNYALTCHKCVFDAFKRMMLTIVPVDVSLEDVQFLDTDLLDFQGDAPDLATSKMPYLSCHTQLILDETDTQKNDDLRFCYVQFYDMFHEKFICKVCNPGYKAIYDESNEIKECQKIQNCDLTLTPGICDKCDENYIFGSIHPEDQLNEFSQQNRNTNIDKTKCIFLGKDAEFVLAIDQDDNNNPVACKSGAKLNFLTNSCEALISDKNDPISNCKGYSNQSCLECSSGYWMKFSFKNIHQCKLANDFIFRNSGCAVFKNDFTNPDEAFTDDIQCLQCYEGYQLDSVSKTCIYIQNIYNCLVYNINDINDPKCSQCSVGYELNSNFTCDIKSSLLPEDHIKNCSLLNDKNNCAICKPNYYLINVFDYSLQAQTTICERISLPSNCEAIDLNLLQSEQKILCTKCNQNYELEFHESSELSTGCERLQSIANCKTQSGTNCAECQQNYFVDAVGKCQKRSNYSSTCLEFKLNEDACNTFYQVDSQQIDDSDLTKIQETIFISPNNATLIEYSKDLPVIDSMPAKEDPDSLIEYQGVDFCEMYLSATRCKFCKTKYWLDIIKNKCLPISQSISNCEYYSSSNECYSCQRNYILINNECHVKTNFTCLENENGSQCSTCPTSKPILNSNKVCEAPSDIHDCEEFIFDSSIGAYICSKCLSYFYLKDGNCLPITSQIQRCLIYDKEGICRVCEDGYYFESTTSSCELAIEFESNCAHFETGGQCSVCQRGFYMNFLGDCIQCLVDTEKCAFCDPLSPSKCLVCNSGFYMNTQEECLQ